MEEGKRQKTPRSSFTVGAIALVFLVIGYQVALFVHKAAVSRVVAHQDRPDTVYVVDRALAEDVLEGRTVLPDADPGPDPGPAVTVRKSSGHAREAVRMREKAAPRKVESFRFDPNTVSLEDLVRLGFSEKQAQSILNYREKGGRFRRPADFAKSYVVADSVFERLRPYIDIPRLDINKADSAAFEALPGIGPYFASKMVSYRTSLGGYSYPEQLLDIYHFDRAKYDGLKELITCSVPDPFPIWTLPEADLARHPYISKAEAHAVVLYREHQPREAWTVEGLGKAGIFSGEHLEKLSRCVLARP